MEEKIYSENELRTSSKIDIRHEWLKHNKIGDLTSCGIAGIPMDKLDSILNEIEQTKFLANWYPYIDDSDSEHIICQNLAEKNVAKNF
jgi:hypothetical protein